MQADKIDTLGILAGGGALPLEIRAACKARGRPSFMLGIEGEAEIKDCDAMTSFGTVGRTIALLKQAACSHVIFAGKVGRPDFGALKLDWRGAKLLPQVIAAARKGDDALLRVLAQVLEREGFRLIGVDDIAEQLVAPPGALGRYRPTPEHWQDIAKATQILHALGSFDIGQAAVVCDGHVLGIEAAEGTDAMLRRCAELPQALRGAAGLRRGVLVKLPKTVQERRIDLPVVGRMTVEGAAAAGLAGIALAAGRAILLGQERTVQCADEMGLFVYGLSAAEQKDS